MRAGAMATAPRNGEHTGSAPPTLHTVLEAWSAVQQELEPQVQAMQKELGGSRWLEGGRSPRRSQNCRSWSLNQLQACKGFGRRRVAMTVSSRSPPLQLVRQKQPRLGRWTSMVCSASLMK